MQNSVPSTLKPSALFLNKKKGLQKIYDESSVMEVKLLAEVAKSNHPKDKTYLYYSDST